MDEPITVGRNVCSEETLKKSSPQHHHLNCNDDLVAQFNKSITEEAWRVNALLLVTTILALVIVGVGSYGHRYRHHGFTRYLYLGATTLFLSVTSILLSANSIIHGDFNVSFGHFADNVLTAQCRTNTTHQVLVILCVCFIQISAANSCVIVASDGREDREIAPPFELIVHGIWTFFLVVNNDVFNYWLPADLFFYAPFGIIYAKLAYKYYAFQRARRSFALGQNPHLIIGYMQRLREGPATAGESVPPPLVVMGEGGQVEKQPHGYLLENSEGLVTIERVWQSDNMLLVSMPQLKDICLSFALFKLLRCRFARYKPTDATCTETLNFLKGVLLKDGRHERAFGVIADELLRDYYYSSLPISYSIYWLPISSCSISILTIGFLVAIGMHLMSIMLPSDDNFLREEYQIFCTYFCLFGTGQSDEYNFGNLYIGLVPMFLLSALVVMSEAMDVTSYICSKWTKVQLTCRSINNASLQKKWSGLLLRCRCKLTKGWNGEISQCSMLTLHPRKASLVLLRRLLRLSDQKKSVKVSTPVKVCIIKALRTSFNGGLSRGHKSLCKSQVGERFLWACSNKGTSDTMLIWHIATCILEVRHQDYPHSEHQIAATHLSRYCAYLVAYCPELLPDDDAWGKELYKNVKKDADRVLIGGIGASTPEAECHGLVEKLVSRRRKHEVLKNGAKLEAQMAELNQGEAEMVWDVLAGFWSEMTLYVAPSDNLNGHAEAIARGGELITLLWALLTHLGIVDRPDDDIAATTASAPGTV